VAENRTLTFSSGIVAVFIIGLALRLAKTVFFPFFLALFFYFILSPVLEFLGIKLRISKPIIIIVLIVLTFSLLYLTGAIFYSSGKTFALDLPNYEHKLSGVLDSLRNSLGLSKSQWDPLAWAKNLKFEKIGALFLTSLGTFVNFISNLFLVFVFLVFMLAGRGRLTVKIKNAFPAHQASHWNRILEKIDHQIQKYLAIKTVISLLSGILTTIILVIFGVHYAVLFGIITFVLNYIPNIGSFISKIFPFLLALLQYDSAWPAIWLAVVLTVVDAVISMILEPKMLGTGLGLSPLAILFSLFFWGWLWGIPGMILAVPLMAILKIISVNFPALKFVDVLLGK
jgi:AI-2 transport protein TqsA